jgi:predicted NAD/FAD-binding protein
MRIAVVGSGVAGLVAAHRLQERHDVVLFEADHRLGGHANTVLVPGDDDRGAVAVDTGFLVFNTRTYPNFVALLRELRVPWTASEMSFSVRSDARDFEYNGRGLADLYAQRRNVLSPRFHRMVWDILRFYREARELLRGDDDPPLREWLERRRYSRQFIDDHLLPMVRAVWSARRDSAERFPARFLVRFFENHGFLEVGDRPQWLTIPGGSRTYVDAIAAGFRGQIRLASPVERIRRQAAGVLVKARGAEAERFDHAVVACHADQALRMLEDPSPLESEVLAAFPYQRNEAVLHTDERLMPRLRRSWASWNVHLDDEGVEGACVTYWLNSLQPLATRRNLFVTLNRTAAIDPARILRVIPYAHPVFDLAGVAAQTRHHEMIDHRGVSYCGAYWRNGFHEDGVVAALAVCRRLGRDAAERAA